VVRYPNIAPLIFFQLQLTGRTEDAFRNPTVLYSKLTNLACLVDGGVDLSPTDQSVEMNKELQQQLAEAQLAAKTLNEKLFTNSTRP
jgi:hypothetical protein